LKEASVKKKQKLYEGKAKIVYETDNEELLIQEFTDDAATPDAAKKGKIKSKGLVNNQMSAHLFTYLDSYHVPTHFVKSLANNSMIVKRLEMIPVEVVMRNIAAGSAVKRLGVEEGKELERPVLEYYLKDNEKEEPMVDDHHILALEYASAEELKQIERFARKINAVLKSFFQRRKLLLVDFTLEFGRNKSGKLTLGDQISADTCHFLDAETGEKLTKDKSRQDITKIEESYEDVRQRVFK
jgi:phosphoribosylaminoimidazole-succinocarboxamide synthase